MTRLIMYRGKQYKLPEWANFIASDSDGTVYVYEKRPVPSTDGEWEPEQTYHGQISRFARILPVSAEDDAWKNSLEEVYL